MPWNRLPHVVFACLLGMSASLAGSAQAARVPNIDPAIRSGDRQSRDAALIIGNEAYGALPHVMWAADDARSFRGWATLTRGIAEGRTRLVTNASAREILREVRRVGSRARKGGTVWIYFAGHGSISDDGKRLLLGVDADASNLEARGVELAEVVRQVERSRQVGRIVLILDAGFGNTGRDGLELVPGRQVEVAPGFSGIESDRVTVWAASQDGSRAQAFEPAKHGLFTWAAIGALRGWADGELDGQLDQRVSLAEAQAFVDRAGRHLGRVASPSQDKRAEVLDWVLSQGAHLEPAPPDDVFDTLAREDLQRRVEEAEARVRVEAGAFWQDTLAIAEEGGPAGRQALEAYIAEFSRSKATLSWSVYVPEVKEARRILLGYDDARGMTEGVVVAPPAEQCEDLLLLESPAMLGQLTAPQRTCLETRIRSERLQTGKAKISLVLLANAEAAGDRVEWERLIARHLEDIDRSDPDLCFAYALYLHKKGDVEAAEEAVRWADYALENKQSWEAEEHTKKVYGLLRLRAEAAQRLWNDAEQRYRTDASPENDALTKEFRGWAKDFSREWLDYARASGQAADKALQLCTSAAGTTAFCQEGAPR